jgi:hypothetical protein
MKKITFLALAIFFSLSIFSQEFVVPQNIKLEKAEDYAPLENDVLKAIDWLYETPINEQQEKRTKANAFLLQWLAGSPYVHLNINTDIITFIKGTPYFLMVFMVGWAKYSIESKDYDNQVAGNLAGIEMVISFYEKNKKQLQKNKEVEKYIKMQKKGTLEEYIRKNV